MAARRGPGCVADERLERFVAQEAPDREVAAHVRDCRACARRAARLRENNDFLAALVVPSPRAAAEPPPPGQVAGYRILAELHRGGQGVVYRALHLASKRIVALKMPLRGGQLSARAVRRFEREVELIARLRHPHLVTLYDSGKTADGQLYFAMELVDGLPLDEYWRAQAAGAAGQSPRARARTAIALLARICEAVQHAHQRGVIHRDLKPGNILIDAGGAPHVLDFGVAKLLEPEPGEVGATRPAEFVGTLRYAAPEQVEGSPDLVDTRTDVYALGVIAFELLTGRLPYELEGGIADVVRTISTQAPHPAARRSPAVDEELETLLLKALAKPRERRYQTAGELGRDLERYLAGAPIDAKRDSTWYLLRKAASRSKGRIAVAGLAGLAVLVGAIALLVGLVLAESAAKREETAKLRAAYEQARAASEAGQAEVVAQILHEVLPRDDPLFQFDARGRTRLDTWIESGQFAGRPEVEAAVRRTLGMLYRERGALPLAEVQFRQALRLRTVALGDEHPDVAQSLNDLAELLLERGSLPEAERRAHRGLELRRRMQGDVHADIAESLDTLARIALRRGQPGTAEELCRQALGLRAQQRTGPQLGLARSWDTRALLLQQAGRLAAAQEACRRALRLRLTLLSDRQPELARNLLRLAELVEAGAGPAAPGDGTASQPTDPLQDAPRLRRLAAALGAAAAPGETEGMWRELLALKNRVLGPEHPDVADSLVELGEFLNGARRYDEAEPVLCQALASYEHAFGPDDLRVADCLTHLAFARSRGGPSDPRAVPLLKRRYEIYRAGLLGRDDVAIGIVQTELAYALQRGGDAAGAEQHYRGALAHYAQTLGPENRQISHTALLYAEMLLEQRRFGEAERMARRGLEVRTLNDAAGRDLYRAALQASIGAAQLGQGRFGEAELALLDAAAVEAELRAADQPSPNLAGPRLVRLYEAWDRPAEAERWRRAAATPPPAATAH